MDLRKPPKLQRGDTIGVVAPCLPVLPNSKAYYNAGIKQLHKLGFKTKEGKTVGLNHWWSAGTPEQQAADINAMFTDKEVKAVVAASGGHTAISVLELLDYDLIAKHPKPFIGMSDMTCYHLALYAKANLVGFHMDEVSFGMGMNWAHALQAIREQTEKLYMAALTSDQPLGVIPPLRERKTWRPGKATGRLIGGNIASLARQIGSPYFPPLDRFDGVILFWEAVGLHRHAIYQMLYQLKYAGVFERISGMLIGTITATQKPREEGVEEPTFKELVTEVLKGYDFPILAGMDFGHYTVNLPMPIGIKAKMDASKQTLELNEAAVI